MMSEDTAGINHPVHKSAVLTGWKEGNACLCVYGVGLIVAGIYFKLVWHIGVKTFADWQ